MEEIYGVEEDGGGWRRLVEVRGGWGRLLPTQGLIQLPREEPGAGLAIVEGTPFLVRQQTSFMSEPQRVPNLAERGKRDVQEATELLAAATCRSFDDVRRGGKRGAPCLRGEPVAFVIGEPFCDPVDRQGELVAFTPRVKPFVP